MTNRADHLFSLPAFAPVNFGPHAGANGMELIPVLPHSRQDLAPFEGNVKFLPLQHHAGPEAIADGASMILRTDSGQHLQYPARRAPIPRPQ